MNRPPRPPENFESALEEALEREEKLKAEVEQWEEALDIRYSDIQRQEKIINELKAKIDGYNGAILEPLREKYKYVCEQNVKLQDDIVKLDQALKERGK